MNWSFLITAFAGPVISGAVSALKGNKVVANNPKLVALAASVGVAALQQGFSWHGVDVGGIATQILVPFAGAVATHEVATNGIVTTSSNATATAMKQ